MEQRQRAAAAGGKAAATAPDRRFSVAPMMDCTDRHCRMFLRLISRRALLYTEMVTAGAIVRGDRKRHLRFDPFEQPVALQLGGSDPLELAEAARIGEDFGYREVNLNVGCPSDRVRTARFGACLMAEPELVGECAAMMAAAVTVPVTVKCRIGIDDQDSEADLERFISTVSAAGCRSFIVHARKAWLDGLSPKQNRQLPPLDYARVYRLKQAHPELEIVLNGGIETLAAAEAHLSLVDGVMLGRAAYRNPYLLADVDTRVFGASESPLPRAEVMRRFADYAARELRAGVGLHQMTRHVLGLYLGQPGARAFRRILSEHAGRGGAGITVLQQALERVEGSLRQTRPAAAE